MRHYNTHLCRTCEMRLQALSARQMLFVLAFLVCVGAAAFGQAPSAADATANAAAPRSATPRQFELLSARVGWLLAGQELFWTTDAGDNWRLITPRAFDEQRVADVYFLDENTGWVLLLPSTGNGAGRLARTVDGGATWQLEDVVLPGSDRAASYATWHLAWVDAQTGWLAAERATSSNFSAGQLWQTQDGGRSWQERTLPAGTPAGFVDAQSGWTVGGARGDELWRTVDGGATWHPQAVAVTSTTVRIYLPTFARDGQTAILPVLVRTPAGQQVEWHVSQDGGASWQWARRWNALATAATTIAASDPRAWLAAQTGQMPRPPVQAVPYFANPAVDSQHHIVAVSMATLARGWALAEPGKRLLRTEDGGANWQLLQLPPAMADLATAETASVAPAAPAAPVDTGARTSIAEGAAFDICELPSPGELSTWFASSPYRIVNLYIGGVLRFCDNENLTAQTIEQLATEGWKFIPTWVGPQAPCAGYFARFSADPGVAYAQGMDEADAALAAAQALGLSEGDGSGTIVYYDLESFDGEDDACVDAAQAFVSGWTHRLHERNSQAGLYGSACNPRMAEFATLAEAPDAVWVAQWNRSTYDPAMTVWGIACLDNSLWSASQRIRQYTPGHDETWGGVTFNIDSNVLDSIVADPHKVTVEPQPVVTLETPVLTPAYNDGMCGAGWHMIVNARGYPAYLAANRDRNGTIPPPATPQTAQWEAVVPEDGYYRVEAFVPAHEAVEWQCPVVTLPADTAAAAYTVVHAEGTVARPGDQAAHAGAWLLLGIFPFRTEITATVTLETATLEPDLTRTVAVSALRLQRVEEGMTATDFVYLPAVRR